MTIKLNDIRDLRIDWRGDSTGSHSASIHFESGDRRFHVWLSSDKAVAVELIDEVSFRTESVLHSNPIEEEQPTYGRSTHRSLDFNAATYRALRDLLVLRIKREYGDLDSAVRAAAEGYVVDRDAKAKQHRVDLANNIRAALQESMEKPTTDIALFGVILSADDDTLIQLRGAMYSANYPDSRLYDGSGSVKL